MECRYSAPSYISWSNADFGANKIPLKNTFDNAPHVNTFIKEMLFSSQICFYLDVLLAYMTNYSE